MRRRVPRRYAKVDPRTFVKISLKTDSRAVAELKAKAAWAELIDGWEARLAGDTDDADDRFAAAREIAQKRGFRFLPVQQVARLPVEEIVERIEAATDRIGRVNKQEADALLGVVKPPEIMLAGILDEYWPFARDKIRGKSPDQLRRWRNPQIKAFKNLLAITGNKPLSELTRDDMLDLVQWWQDKIERENLTPNSANKDFTYIASVLRRLNEKKRLGLDVENLVGRLRIAEHEKGHRPPFSTTWIREKLLAPGALSGLNGQARGILIGMINTGYRPSEAASLLPEHIVLDATIPHIVIAPEGRQLKSQYSRRSIPLTGVSLEAFRQNPRGFPRYADNPALSATVNKFLRENGLQETPEHTLYCLRHSFEDRLLAAEVDERIRRDLMGHTLNRQRYGHGASLEHMHGILKGVAI
nr:DUF6538 domain-containing protein [Maritimibacter sp. DP1N21-5]